MKPTTSLRPVIWWLLSFLCFVLTSPKWTFGPAAWLAPAFLLLFVDSQKISRGLILAFTAIYSSALVANYLVTPFPLVFLFVIYIKAGILGILPYAAHRILVPRINHWLSIFVFPSTHVLVSYLSVWSNGGSTWGLTAYTQTDNLPLIQLASITGIWGISFMIHWFAALAARLAADPLNWKEHRMATLSFTACMVVVLLFGFVRINPYFSKPQRTVRVAGITGNSLSLIAAMYEDAFHQPVNMKINELTMSSPELQELQKGMIAYIEDPRDDRFEKTRLFSETFIDSLFLLADQEARAGAKIISFSEALMFVVKEDENILLDRGRALARKHGIHVVLPAAVILPGKMDGVRKWLENRCWLIGADGELLSSMLKNRPVPIAEAGSIAGDGVVPVAPTTIGNIATSICYDADFPDLMRQAGMKKTDLMILPSGDWKEISPIHAQMAVMRAVENGFSLLRPVSYAYSIAADYTGKILAQRSYYDQGAKVLIAYLPIERVNTLYTQIGDAFVFLCAAVLIVLSAWPVFRSFRIPEKKTFISA